MTMRGDSTRGSAGNRGAERGGAERGGREGGGREEALLDALRAERGREEEAAAAMAAQRDLRLLRVRIETRWSQAYTGHPRLALHQIPVPQ
eukprot:1156936-Prorocentrum_minimum.AAC.1